MFIKQLQNRDRHKIHHLLQLAPSNTLAIALQTNYFKKYFLATLLFILLLNSSNVMGANLPVTIIAKIDKQAITNIDLIDRYHLVTKISKIKFNTKEEKQIIIDQILQKMIDEELQIKEAKSLGIEIDQEKLHYSIKEIANSLSQTPENLKDSFRKNSISYPSFIKQVESQILWSDAVRKTTLPKIKVSQSEIDELLEFRKIKPEIEKFFLAEIFIPSNYKNENEIIDGKDLSRKLFDELQKGKNFNNIVKQFSRSGTAEFNGEIGWVGEGDIDNKIYKIIKTVKLGEVSKPILMNDGYHIFKVTNKKTFSTLTEEDISQIKKIILNKKLQVAARGYLMDLRKSSYIEIDQKGISDLFGY